jgi:hypothetical protein
LKRVICRYRQVLALELAAKGMPYDDIAQELGFSNRSGAWKAVQRALDRREAEAVEAYRAHALSDLEMVQERAWGRAMAGQLDAAELVVRTIEARCRLLRL